MTKDPNTERLAAELCIAYRWAHALARSGVTDVSQLENWTLYDVKDLRWVGELGQSILTVAIRRRFGEDALPESVLPRRKRKLPPGPCSTPNCITSRG